MKVKDMKTILYNKLQDENCYFTKSDIDIRKINDKQYKIIIKDYEHITFDMVLCEYTEQYGYMVVVNDLYENACIIINDNKHNYDIENVLINLGYYIGNTF